MIVKAARTLPIDHTVMTRVWPFTAAVMMFLLTLSGIQPTYFEIFGRWEAIVSQAVYGVLMLVLSIFPDLNPKVHRFGATMAVFIFLGKAVAFGELFVAGSTHLGGSSASWVLMAISAFLWHWARGRKVVQDGRPSS